VAWHRYTAETVDWIAVYDDSSERRFYVPAAELADGRSVLALRLTPARNGQRQRIRDAERYSVI
jgi:PD-(D/E)XK endonuclease